MSVQTFELQRLAPPSHIHATFQHEAAAVFKKTKGHMGKIAIEVIKDLQKRGLVSTSEARVLYAAYDEALDVLADKKSAASALISSRRRYVDAVASPEMSDVARALLELCQASVRGRALLSDESTHGTLRAAAAATIEDPGAQAVIWGAIGALVGGSLGGPGGALLGAGVGAAFGGCVDGPTTITPTGGGGLPA